MLSEFGVCVGVLERKKVVEYGEGQTEEAGSGSHSVVFRSIRWRWTWLRAVVLRSGLHALRTSLLYGLGRQRSGIYWKKDAWCHQPARLRPRNYPRRLLSYHGEEHLPWLGFSGKRKDRGWPVVR